MSSFEQDEKLRRLLAAWSGKRQSGQPPAYGTLRPEEIRFMLPDLCLIDVLPDGGFRFRLAGTGVVDRLRRDPTGQTLDVLPPAAAAPLAELFALAATCASPVAASGRLNFGGNDRVLDALCLPLAGAEGSISVLLVGLAFRPWSAVVDEPPEGELVLWEVDPRLDLADRAVSRRACACV